MLLMKKVFFDAIRRGAKTVTLRLWRHQMVRPGQVHTIPGLGRVRIEAVREVALSELTEADAAADGFASVGELLAALKKMYPALGQDGGACGRKLYAVHFKFPAE